MIVAGLRWIALGAAVLPSIYYLLVIIAARQFFRRQRSTLRDFTPPISILKPVRGLDCEAYENFASYCRQDYPIYEILFAVSDEKDAVVPVIRKLIADFPNVCIRLVVGRKQIGSSDKVNKLCALAHAAQHDLLVTADADIRVAPGHLRAMAAPFRDPHVGAASSLFNGMALRALCPELEAIHLSTEFMSSVLIAQFVEGVHFAMGATIAVRREVLEEIGGFEALANEAADDYQLGYRTAARGHRVELVDGGVRTWCCLPNFRVFFAQRLRWAIMARQARPAGYAGLVVSHGLSWTLLAVALAPNVAVGAGFVAAYLILRLAEVWTVGVWGLHDDLLKRRWWLVPLWDALAFVIWLESLMTNRVHWQGKDYRVTGGRLVPVGAKINGHEG